MSPSRNFSHDSPSEIAQITTWEENPRLIYFLISKQWWGSLRSALKSKPGSNSEFFRPILHFACRYHSPLEIFQLLELKFPHSIASVDNMGKWPIHYAAEFGASCDIIKYLACQDIFSAGAQDIMGMTPTHYLCKHYATRHQPKIDRGRPTKDCMFDAIETLIQAAPSSLNSVDKDGMNAIEYAIDSGADFDIVFILQKGCEQQHKKMRTSQARKDNSLAHVRSTGETRPNNGKAKLSESPSVNLSKPELKRSNALAA
mmetsp:Transcript_34783/g.46695  ORF Transcript_34783/g.46695 Transcript_34783/m.46695 type:complete len:258 (+) Transcript_34783:163-936(+)